MQKMRYGFIALWMLLCSVTSATADVSIGISLPSVSIGINLPVYPELVPVPGYPVYYAPRMDANYFFYDGMYWVYQNDYWYASSWYNGPWGIVQPEVVPLFILRVPVSYYRQPPVYFRGWHSNAPPRWGQHWGHSWEQRRGGWDRWDRRSAPSRAPLPVYQRQYTGDRYPSQVEQQHKLRGEHYRYQPRDKAVREHFKQVERRAPAPAQRGRTEGPAMRSPSQQDNQRSTPHRKDAPAEQRSQPQRGGDNVQRKAPDQAPPQQRGPSSQERRQQPAAAQHQQRGGENVQRSAPDQAPRRQQAPKVQDRKQKPQDSEESRGRKGGNGQEDRKDEERGRGRN